MTPLYIYLSPTQRHIQTRMHVTENKQKKHRAGTNSLNPKTEVGDRSEKKKKGRYLDKEMKKQRNVQSKEKSQEKHQGITGNWRRKGEKKSIPSLPAEEKAA